MKRIQKVQKHLQSWEVDLLVIDNPIDLFYLTGEELSAGSLIISADEAILYVDGRYYEACRKNTPLPVVLLNRGDSLPSHPGKRIGFDAQTTTFEGYERFASLQGERIALDSPLRKIRAVKEPGEIELLEKAAFLGSLGYDFLLSQLAEGITEEKLAIELEIFWKKSGGQRVAFSPHIAFGENGAYPHHHSGKHSLKKGESLLIDIGVVLNHYHSDMTRVVFFGKPHPELEKIYTIVYEAMEKAFALCKPGTEVAALDQAARGWIQRKGYGEYFLHSLGHGVGLEIHEFPFLRKNGVGVLEEGMVITIEPGIYLPGIGGVRLEDTIVITKEGFKNLTNRPL